MRPSSATAAVRDSGVGARIREARGHAGLSQRELAEKIGATRDAVSQWERGVDGISWPNLRKVATATGVSDDWLRAGEELDALPERSGQRAPGEVVRFVSEMNSELHRVRHHTGEAPPDLGSGAFLISVLVDMSTRMERLEKILAEALAGDSGNTLVGSTRQTKAMLAAGLDAEDDDSATPAAPDTPREGDAKTGSPPARRGEKRRSASKRGR